MHWEVNGTKINPCMKALFSLVSLSTEQTKWGDFMAWIPLSNVQDKLFSLSFQGSQKLHSSKAFQNKITDSYLSARQHGLALTALSNCFLWRIKLCWINLRVYFCKHIIWGGKLLKFFMTILCSSEKSTSTHREEPYLSNTAH